MENIAMIIITTDRFKKLAQYAQKEMEMVLNGEQVTVLLSVAPPEPAVGFTGSVSVDKVFDENGNDIGFDRYDENKIIEFYENRYENNPIDDLEDERYHARF